MITDITNSCLLLSLLPTKIIKCPSIYSQWSLLLTEIITFPSYSQCMPILGAYSTTGDWLHPHLLESSGLRSAEESFAVC